MVKKIRGQDIDISPPESGWANLWFSDGYKAQIDGAVNYEKNGQKLVKFLLRPYDTTRKRFGITDGDLNKKGQCERVFEREAIKQLNKFDPARQVFFCLYNWNGKPTEATEWLEGTEQVEEIQRLRKNLRELKAKLEKYKEENYMLRNDMQEYIKQHADAMLKPMVPTFKSLMGIQAPPGGQPEE